MTKPKRPQLRVANNDEPFRPDDYVPQQADSVAIAACGDPDCRSAHLILFDSKGQGIAQATVSYEMAVDIFRIISLAGGESGRSS